MAEGALGVPETERGEAGLGRLGSEPHVALGQSCDRREQGSVEDPFVEVTDFAGGRLPLLDHLGAGSVRWPSARPSRRRSAAPVGIRWVRRMR